jgi:hypothetical protein
MSPVGEVGQYAWITRADTAFKQNAYHFEQLFPAADPKAQAMKASIDAALEEALAEKIKTVKPKEAAEWKVQAPYSMETDDDGNETGRLAFKYRQNAVIPVKDEKGAITEKPIKIALADSSGNEVVGKVAIYSGSMVAARYSIRTFAIAKDKIIGCRLDFNGVQIAKLVSGGGGGFGKLKDGEYNVSDDSMVADEMSSAEAPAASADY